MSAAVSDAPAETSPNPRRNFIYVATGATAAIGVAAGVWPLIDALNPSSDVLALAAIEVDISGVALGTQLTVKWRGRPVFIRRRTRAEIEAARATPLAELKDPVDEAWENPNHRGALPALDGNRTVDPTGEWLVLIGVCTHLGCVPLGNGAGNFGGWFCPCHGSHYDASGRIRKGPAPRNLDIPLYAFVTDTLLRIG